MAFEMMPKKVEWHPFLFSTEMQYLRPFVYYIFEHINYAIACAIIWIRPQVTMTIKCFCILAILDGLEYWATGSEVWFFYHWFPVSFNTLQIIIFGIVCGYEEVKNA